MDFLWISYGKNGGIHQASPSYGPSRRPRRPCSVGWSRRAPQRDIYGETTGFVEGGFLKSKVLTRF